jgi:hypothetical protein
MEVVYKIFIDNKCIESIFGTAYYYDKKNSFDHGFTQFETLSKTIKRTSGKVTILRMGDDFEVSIQSHDEFKKWVEENYKSFAGACK